MKIDRDLLTHVAKEAYLLGLKDAPAIMGQRGNSIRRFRELEENVNFELVQWPEVIERVKKLTEWSFIGEPLVEL